MDKYKKRLIIFMVLMGLVYIASILIIEATREMDYTAYADSLDLAEIVDTADLSIEDLQHRNGKLIIERVIGVVEDAETGKGYVLGNENYYICYDDVADISNGNVICTYLIYNPDTNYEDDIIARFDYVIDGR